MVKSGGAKRRVQFNDVITQHNVQAYATVYGMHPRLLKSSRRGMVQVPSACDPFTCKSLRIMRARKLEQSYARDIDAHHRRTQLIMMANEQLEREPQLMLLAKALVAATTKEKKGGANRTPPAKKAHGRQGAKQVKKLEQLSSTSYALSPEEATMYRALSARCNYLAQDKADIRLSAKELCREFAVPNRHSYAKLKRLTRYLVGCPRLVYKFDYQDLPTNVDIYTDTDFAGCKETRRSTSGGVIMMGSHTVRHWSKTQSTLALSSGEAELSGIGTGIAEALGFQSLARDMGWNYTLTVHSDATAAIGIARRRGLGKVRHLDVTDLWIQEKVRSKAVHLQKVPGLGNPADVLTKYVDKATLEKALKFMGLMRMDGRAKLAPKAMGTE